MNGTAATKFIAVMLGAISLALIIMLARSLIVADHLIAIPRDGTEVEIICFKGHLYVATRRWRSTDQSEWNVMPITEVSRRRVGCGYSFQLPSYQTLWTWFWCEPADSDGFHYAGAVLPAWAGTIAVLALSAGIGILQFHPESCPLQRRSPNVSSAAGRYDLSDD